jgi:hypothetical protein
METEAPKTWLPWALLTVPEIATVSPGEYWVLFVLTVTVRDNCDAASGSVKMQMISMVGSFR